MEKSNLIIPLVSIIIPVFNAEKYISRCIDSALKQTYENKEIIIVNDGSTDGSSDILKTFTDPKISVIETLNKGACHSRNIGFNHSLGTYIQFLDADDYLGEEKVALQMNVLQGDINSLAICKTQIILDNQYIEPSIYDEGEIIIEDNNPYEFLLNLYEHYGMIQTNVWLTPRNLILKAGLWNENLKQDQDGEFFCRMVLASNTIKTVNHKLNYHRKFIKETSISNNKTYPYALSTLKALDLKSSYLLSINNGSRTKKVLATHYKILAIRFYNTHHQLYKIALKKCFDLGNTNFTPVMGGVLIEHVKNIFGWKVAKILSIIKKKIIN